MKKFLTVLLALSVVFTYSFATVGTAFAADVTTDYVKSEVQAKISDELKLVEAAKIQSVAEFKATTVPGIAVDKDTKFVVLGNDTTKIFTTTELDTIVALVVDDAGKLLEAQGEDVLKANPKDDAELATQIATINAGDYKTQNGFGGKVTGYKDLAKLSLEYAKDRYSTIVKDVNLNDYSDERDATTGVSNRDKVIDLQNKALEAIETATVAYGGGADTVQVIANKFVNDLAEIDTVADTSYEAADLTAVKELAISAMTAAYATEKAALIAEQNAIIRNKDSKADEVAVAKEAIEVIEETYSAAVGLLKDQIDDLTSLKDLNVYGADGNKWVIGTYADGRFTPSEYLTNAEMKYLGLAVAKADKIAELKDDAAMAKKFIGIEGSKYFSEEEVDNALEVAVKSVYRATDEANIKAIDLHVMTPAQALAERIKALIGAADKNVVVDKKAYPTVKDWADDATKNYTYDSDVATAVADLAEATEEALKEAKTIADAEKIFLDAYAEFDAYVTDTEHAKLYRKGGALYEDFTSYEKQIIAAVEAKKIVTAGNDDYSFDASKDENSNTGEFAKNLIEEMKKANTKADLDAKFAEAKEIVANVKTVSAIKAEAKALNDRALAIKDAESADKAEVVAILDGYAEIKKYIETIDMAKEKEPVLYESLVTSYLQAIADGEAKAINDAIKAVGKVTVEDKEAVEKIVADAEALEQLMADYGLTATNPAVGDVDALAEALAKAEVNKVVEMIMNLDTVVTADNINDVRAAKAAYEALNAAQKASVDNNKVVYDKLVAVVKLADKYEINAVKTLKVVKNHSVAGKGYIKLAWSTVGDAKAADGYQVFRSKKMNSGYGTKAIFTTKSGEAKTYKNTTVKKGTKYYYKVRAFKVVDGKKYYSDWSNKAYRVAK